LTDFDAAALVAALPLPRLLDGLETAFRAAEPPAGEAVTLQPDAGGMTALTAATGATVARFDPTALGVFARIGVAALAARYLARPDARHVALTGADAVAALRVRAFAAIRPIRRVTVVGPVDTARLAALTALGVTTERADAPVAADIAVDDAARDRLDAGLHVDTRDTLPVAVDRMFTESPDADTGAGTLTDLCRGAARGRRNSRERTAFVATASSLALLTTARLAVGAP
jgi:ornithine cyclodeaminase